MLTTCQAAAGQAGKDLNQQAAPPRAQTLLLRLPTASGPSPRPLLAGQARACLSSPGRESSGVAEGPPRCSWAKATGSPSTAETRNSFSSAPNPALQRTSCRQNRVTGVSKSEAPKGPSSSVTSGQRSQPSCLTSHSWMHRHGDPRGGEFWLSDGRRAADPPGEPRLALGAGGPRGRAVGAAGERPGLDQILPRATQLYPAALSVRRS